MTHCTVVTSAPNSCSIAGSAPLNAVKSLATTRTANAIAARPRIVDLFSGPSACVISLLHFLSYCALSKEWSSNASRVLWNRVLDPDVIVRSLKHGLPLSAYDPQRIL